MKLLKTSTMRIALKEWRFRHMDLLCKGTEMCKWDSDIPIFIMQSRMVFESIWGSATAHPSVAPLSKIGSSSGQCFVTAYCLRIELKDTFGLESSIARGSLLCSSGQQLIGDHCWLQYRNDSGEVILVDLTADQAEFVDWKVIVGTKSQLLAGAGYDYAVARMYSDQELCYLNEATERRCRTLMRRYQRARAYLVSQGSCHVA